jgi:hypothetical protein
MASELVHETKLENYSYDPLLTCVKLAMLIFHENGTKLSLYNKKIYVQPPSYTQGASRKLYGNSKEELVNLFIPLKQCLNTYGDNPYVKEILKLATDGLNILQKTYENNPGIVLQLQFLIEMINDYLEGYHKTYNNLKSLSIFKDYNNKPVHKELWNDLSVNVLNKHLMNSYREFLSKDNDNKFDEELKKLEGFIEAKEKRYSELYK